MNIFGGRAALRAAVCGGARDGAEPITQQNSLLAGVEDIALTMIPGVGARYTAMLLEHFGSAAAIFGAPHSELEQIFQRNPDIVNYIIKHKGFKDAEKELEYCRRNDITALAVGRGDYPELLAHCGDAPSVLYVMGNIQALNMRTVSVVGSRKVTSYGDRWCTHLIGNLAERVPELSVVSGLAFGVDAAAHRAALAVDVPTVAVLANPLPSITPAQHSNLGRQILERGGALVSELHSQTKMRGHHYIPRNRIIAALSPVTLIIESALDGGSMHTAKMAFDYSREVLALPGRISDPQSAGCNMLIRNNIANILIGAEDVIKAAGWQINEPSTRSVMGDDLSEVKRSILGCFSGEQQLTIDEVAQICGLDVGTLSMELMELEFAGLVKAQPGNRYSLFGGQH